MPIKHMVAIFIMVVVGICFLYLSADRLDMNKHGRELLRLELQKQMKVMENDWLEQFNKAKKCKGGK